MNITKVHAAYSFSASKFQNTDIVMLGLIVIGIIGYGIDILMRKAEDFLVPWKGKS